MAVPDFQTLMRPLLTYGQDGGEKNIREAIKALADEFHLSEQERNQLLPSGKQTTLQNRVYWARFYLDKAGALKKTNRSHFIITDRGRELLQKWLSGIDLQDHLVARGHCIPIIFMTGYPDDNVRARAMKAEAVCFLNKPLSPDHFIGCIEKVLKAA